MKRKELLYPIILFLFALLIRLALLYPMHHTVLFQSPVLDAEYYDTWAQQISQGDWKGGESVYPMSPGYPYILAVCNYSGHLTIS